MEAFFNAQFPDAVPLLPHLVPEFLGNPAPPLVTVRCSPFHYTDKCVLLGDACHAIGKIRGIGKAGRSRCARRKWPLL